MTVNRFDGERFEEVSSIGHGETEASVKVRRDDSWEEIWPSVQPTGPDGEWELSVSDDFDQGTLDTDLWGINAGSDVDAFDDDAVTDPRLVTVADGTLTLTVESDGTGTDGVSQGVVSTYPGDEDYHATTGFATGNEPGVYVETRAKLAGPRNGLLPAFWMNGIEVGGWPPEIDIYELFMATDSPTTTRTDHSGHWATTEKPGDYEDAIGIGYQHDHGDDVTNEYHVYGAAWFRDRIEFYIDGSLTGTLDLLPMLNTMNDPDRSEMYLKFTTHVNRVGTADLDTSWTEETEIDYVRVWEFAGTPSNQPTPPSYTTLDTFTDGSIDGGWTDPNDGWRIDDNYANSGSHPLTNTANRDPIGWEGSPDFSPGITGTRLEYDFAFSDRAANRLNVRFGATGANDTQSYRLDILEDAVFLFETNDWDAISHDSSYRHGRNFAFHTAQIEFTEHNIRYEIRSPTGELLATDALYHTEGFGGGVPVFECEEGQVWIDEVRIAST
ncbi:family 16 glycosylhydrolase [Haloterrigena sp. SYSU A121-1]|uniref:Family 16 glycosylhydrolase n=1 Tax=Haloterrigena gelatinilytica TaxID=2741724 RepID=A0A8J8GTI6_9EURY|nr:family 16 glycosylhydrolase [Haloterrigena gelatinilytica]NUB93737.1 family 16 glycosylhydrolase [Haloterrigena gelatinilytica]